MNRTTDRNADAVSCCHRDRTKALLAYAVERHVTGHGQPLNHAGDGPWDVWWVCYRTQRTAAEFGLNPRRAPIRCEVCAIDASTLASHTPPKHPDEPPRQGCPCLLDWARSMRRSTPDIAWPGWQLTVSMVKPGRDPIPRARATDRKSHCRGRGPATPDHGGRAPIVPRRLRTGVRGQSG